MVGAVGDAAIPLLGGAWCTLLGFRLVGKPGQDARYEEWYGRWGVRLRVLGPLVAAFGLIRFGIALVGDGARTSPEAAAASLAGIQPGEEREVQKGMFLKMHQMQVANLKDGWQTATSTEGGFSVELPLPYNDARIRTVATDGVDVHMHTLGGKTPGLLSWNATCIVRRDETLGPGAGEPSDTTEVMGTPPVAEVRTVRLADRLCTLIVEAQGTDPLPAESSRARFLQSFRTTGAPSW